MGLSITITPSDGGTALNFVAPGSALTGRFALHFDSGNPIRDLKRFRVPGISGSYIVDGGEIGHNPVMLCRYISNSLSNAESLYASDRVLFSSNPQEIVCNGQTYSGCIMNTCKRNIKDRGSVSGYALIDVEYIFSEDNPA